MDCELCSAKNANRVGFVEGVKMILCDRCINFGREINAVPIASKKEGVTIRQRPMREDVIVADYARIIREARQKKGLELKDFALKINEKHTLLSKIEAGAMTPTIALARKVEKFLGIELVETGEDVKVGEEKDGTELTLGDVIKVK